MTASSQDWFDSLRAVDAERVQLWSHPPSGLRAVLVIDDLTLGPAAGGTRTLHYPSTQAALADAAALARAMTIKCALGGVAAGGCKIVVCDGPRLRREEAFARLGQLVQELGGLVRTAGDAGTSAADLLVMAQHTDFVHVEEATLAASVARGLVRCVQACRARRSGGRFEADRAPALEGLRVAVQGCGSIGGAAARALRAAGAEVVVADVDRQRAEAVATAIGAMVIEPAECLLADVDVVSPCALGEVVTLAVAEQMRGWALVGAANNALAGPAVGAVLQRRGILHVPDVIASAGAVIDGIGRTVMGLSDRSGLVDQLGATAYEVLVRASSGEQTPQQVAEALAAERLAAGRDRAR